MRGREFRHTAGNRLSCSRDPKGRAIPHPANRGGNTSRARRRPGLGPAEDAATGWCAMHGSIKRFLPLAAVLLASLCAACSGGPAVVGPPPPPPAGTFSNASLKEQYAFCINVTEPLAGAPT